MSMFDGLLGQIAENVDVQNLATKIGLPADQVEQAIHALAVAHPQPGDTAEAAAAQTGLPTDKLQEIIGHIGGEGSLSQFASLIDGNGGIGEKLSGLASGLFGKG